MSKNHCTSHHHVCKSVEKGLQYIPWYHFSRMKILHSHSLRFPFRLSTFISFSLLPSPLVPSLITPYADLRLVPIHSHPLRIPAQLAIRTRADRPAPGVSTTNSGTALLEREQLLGAEGLVVDLRGRLDEVLQVRAQEEVAQVHEFAVVLVFD